MTTKQTISPSDVIREALTCARFALASCTAKDVVGEYYPTKEYWFSEAKVKDAIARIDALSATSAPKDSAAEATSDECIDLAEHLQRAIFAKHLAELKEIAGRMQDGPFRGGMESAIEELETRLADAPATTEAVIKNAIAASPIPAPAMEPQVVTDWQAMFENCAHELRETQERLATYEKVEPLTVVVGHGAYGDPILQPQIKVPAGTKLYPHPQPAAVAGTVVDEPVCQTCGGSMVDPGGLPICRDCVLTIKEPAAVPGELVGWFDAEFNKIKWREGLINSDIPHNTPLYIHLASSPAPVLSEDEIHGHFEEWLGPRPDKSLPEVDATLYWAFEAYKAGIELARSLSAHAPAVSEEQALVALQWAFAEAVDKPSNEWRELAAKTYAALSRHAPTAGEGWISVEERLPNLNTPVALLNIERWSNTGGSFDCNVYGAGYLAGDESHKYWSCFGEGRGLTLDSFTHWASLAATPQSDKGEDR